MDLIDFDFEDRLPAVATGTGASNTGGPGGRSGPGFGGLPSTFAGREKKTLGLKDVVCRYWIKGRCTKEEKCEFLHQWDPARMPECRFGSKCNQAGCEYKHTSDELKEICMNYEQGFCSFGPQCRYRHVKKSAAELPELAQMFREQGWRGDGRRPGINLPDPAGPNAAMFKVSICKFFQQGHCPYGDKCTFAHSESEKRSAPPPGSLPPSHRNTLPPASSILAPPLPGSVGKSRYFVIKTKELQNILHSVRRKCWFAHPKDVAAVNDALSDPEVDNTFLFFGVRSEKSFMGVARVLSPFRHNIGSPHMSCEVEWIRACGVPFLATRFIRNVFTRDLVAAAGNWEEIPPRTGQLLMALMYKAPEDRMAVDVMPTIDWVLDDPTVDDARMDDIGEAQMSAVEAYTSGMLPPGPSLPAIHSALVFSDRPGFLFWCSSRNFDLIKRTGVMVAPDDCEKDAKLIGHGTPLLLYHMEERRLHGIYMARGPATVEPAGPFTGTLLPAISRPLLLHVNVMLGVECPSIIEAEASACLIESPPKPGRLEPEQLFAISLRLLAHVHMDVLLQLPGGLSGYRSSGAPGSGPPEPPEVKRVVLPSLPPGLMGVPVPPHPSLHPDDLEAEIAAGMVDD